MNIFRKNCTENKLKQGMTRLRRNIAHAADREAVSHSLMDNMEDLGNRIYKRGKHMTHNLAEQAHEVDVMARRHPVASLAAAFTFIAGIGLLAGFLLRRR